MAIFLYPGDSVSRICPLFIHKNDVTFQQKVVVVEVRRNKGTVSWKRMGVVKNLSRIFKKHYAIEWFDLEPKIFTDRAYKNMIDDFTKHYRVDELLWKNRMAWVERYLSLEMS